MSIALFLYLELTIAVYAFEINAEKVDKRILLTDPSYVHALETKLQELEQKVTQLTTDLSTQKLHWADGASEYFYYVFEGGTFVRWGRNVCPHDLSELVYKGYAGGSWYDHTGAAADYLCMPSDPQWAPNAPLLNWNYVYGVEYQDSMAGTSHFDDDAPCAVCSTTNTSRVLMIPGRLACYPGWILLYRGFLAAGAYANKAASEFVCVDENPEFVPHSGANENGKFFEPVSSKCGSLACPPYIDQKQLSCIVCTK